MDERMDDLADLSLCVQRKISWTRSQITEMTEDDRTSTEVPTYTYNATYPWTRSQITEMTEHQLTATTRWQWTWGERILTFTMTITEEINERTEQLTYERHIHEILNSDNQSGWDGILSEWQHITDQRSYQQDLLTEKMERFSHRTCFQTTNTGTNDTGK